MRVYQPGSYWLHLCPIKTSERSRQLPRTWPRHFAWQVVRCTGQTTGLSWWPVAENHEQRRFVVAKYTALDLLTYFLAETNRVCNVVWMLDNNVWCLLQWFGKAFNFQRIHFGNELDKRLQWLTDFCFWLLAVKLRKRWSGCVNIPALSRFTRTYCFSTCTDKSDADTERERSLIDQWVCLTEERNAVLVPTSGSGIPGAPADW